jgi:DNA-binding response OmpR family regulator
MMVRILLIANRKTTIDSLKKLIDTDDIIFLEASNQRSALQLARVEAPDLIILDTTSTRLGGARLSRDLRRLLDAPIIAIVREEQDATELGATDYLIKPYTGRQLLNSVCQAMQYPRELMVGPISLNLRQRCVYAPHMAGPQPLNPKLFALLRLLIHCQGQIVTREQLMAEVWSTDFMEDTRTLDVHIRWIREIIEPDPALPLYLKTVRGIGYRLALPLACPTP